MAALTIRNLDDETKRALRVRAARRGSSMEDEARSILRVVVEADLSLDDLAKKTSPTNASAWDSIRALREKYGTFEFETPERTDVAGSRDVFGGS